MSKIAVWASKACLVVILAALGFAMFVPSSVYALSPSDTGTPPAPAYPGLQRAWAREQRVYDRLGRLFNNIDQRLSRGQELIDKAKANGKDVTALQAALDAFSVAVKQARPMYEGLNGIVSSHQGFDANGNVVDPVKAFETVLDMRDKLKAIRDIVVPPAKALRQALQDFRAANQPAATPTP